MAERLTWLGLGLGLGLELGLGLGLGLGTEPYVHGREAHMEVHGARADDSRHRAHGHIHDEVLLRGERRPPFAREHGLTEECARP